MTVPRSWPSTGPIGTSATTRWIGDGGTTPGCAIPAGCDTPVVTVTNPKAAPRPMIEATKSARLARASRSSRSWTEGAPAPRGPEVFRRPLAAYCLVIVVLAVMLVSLTAVMPVVISLEVEPALTALTVCFAGVAGRRCREGHRDDARAGWRQLPCLRVAG